MLRFLTYLRHKGGNAGEGSQTKTIVSKQFMCEMPRGHRTSLASLLLSNPIPILQQHKFCQVMPASLKIWQMMMTCAINLT